MASKVTRIEKRRYEMLREAGFPVKAAAETIQRSPSWAYLHEARIRKANHVPPSGVGRRLRDDPPSLDDAAEFVFGLYQDDAERALKVLERFGTELAFPLAQMAIFFAHLEAGHMKAEIGLDVDMKALDMEALLFGIAELVRRYQAGESIEAIRGLESESEPMEKSRAGSTSQP